MERGNGASWRRKASFPAFMPQWWNVDTPDLGSGAGDVVAVVAAFI